MSEVSYLIEVRYRGAQISGDGGKLGFLAEGGGRHLKTTLNVDLAFSAGWDTINATARKIEGSRPDLSADVIAERDARSAWYL